MTTLLLSLILISIWVGFYQLVKQQGRILLRLDALERGTATVDRHSPGLHEPAVFEGLPLGTAFPDFEFPDLSGKARTLAEFRGQRLLLIQWNFDCGFCDLIAPDLARLEPDLERQNTRIVLLASGTESFNREHAASHGLMSLILLLHHSNDKNDRNDNSEKKVPEPFQNQGTPVAYFVDGQAQVAAPFANGADQVLALARRVASSEGEPIESKPGRSRLNSERPLAESRIERHGLRAGTPAPGFRLPDLQGNSISLDNYRGQRVLLVFSDPHCGPCDELAPHLTRLHREHRNNGLTVILVGRGAPEENRSKAEQFGFEFPVVLQEKWKLSKEYGIFATPVAFLIGENGVIASDVAVGNDAILALAADAARLQERSVQ
jgi:peroxiredoxin